MCSNVVALSLHRKIPALRHRLFTRRFWSIALAIKSSFATISAARLPFITFLFPFATSVTSGLRSIAEISLARLFGVGLVVLFLWFVVRR